MSVQTRDSKIVSVSWVFCGHCRGKQAISDFLRTCACVSAFLDCAAAEPVWGLPSSFHPIAQPAYQAAASAPIVSQSFPTVFVVRSCALKCPRTWPALFYLTMPRCWNPTLILSPHTHSDGSDFYELFLVVLAHLFQFILKLAH